MADFEQTEYNQPFNIGIWKRIGPFVSKQKTKLLAILVLMLLSAFVDLLSPLFQRYAIDHFITAGTTQNIGWYAAVYVGVIIVQTLIVIVFARMCFTVEMTMGRDLKRACFVHLQGLSLSYYNTTPVGTIMARVMSDTNRIAGVVAWALLDGFWALAYVAGVFVAMLFLNWRLALLVMTVVPFLAVLTGYFQKKILTYNRIMRKENARITAAYNEGIMGARTSKTLVIEDANSRDFHEITEDMYRASLRAATLNAVYMPIITFFGSLATALVLVRGGYLVMNQALQFGTYSAFIAYAIGIFQPIQQLARVLADIVAAQANVERVADLLDEPAGVTDAPHVVERYGDVFTPKPENWEPLRGDIEFRDVTFRYPDGKETVLEHFNLTIPAGTTVAIVGETGAGKSTLVNLACRFYEPTEGAVLIDGVDVRERSQLWLHSNIGYVLQNPHLFSGTIRENIRYGRLDATDQQIEAVARQVSAHTVAERMEKGYESDVGEGGDRLSTGEKQLISFARAVLADPRIFVLDEATSSVDTHTEQLIQNAIAHILKGRTSFVIAHRLSTIRHADLILVVKDGRIIEQGKHQELMDKHGYYHSLCTRQFMEESTAQLLAKE